MSPKKGYAWVLDSKSSTAKKSKPKRSTSIPPKNEKDTASTIYILEVTLEYVEPKVWRLFTVPGTITLSQLHEALLVVMGWEGRHAWEFDVQGTHYGDSFAAEDPSLQEANNAVLHNTVSMRGTVVDYIYDWGDEWHHQIKVQDIRKREATESSPVILDGANACPPEDVGGVPGYAIFLEAIEDSNHPEHEELLEWVGGKWNPQKFDRKTHQRRLAFLAKKRQWAEP